VVLGDISGQESVSQSFNQVIVEFVKVVPVALYRSETCVFLGIEMIQKSLDNLSHKNSPLHLVSESRIRQVQNVTVLAENTVQSWLQSARLMPMLTVLYLMVCLFSDCGLSFLRRDREVARRILPTSP
jgi:hypothetical protein